MDGKKDRLRNGLGQRKIVRKGESVTDLEPRQEDKEKLRERKGMRERKQRDREGE